MTLRNTLQTALLTLLSLLLISGCASRTRDLDPNASIHYDASYDFSDKKVIVNDLVGKIIQAPFAMSAEKPLIIIYPFSNETSEHINTRGVSDDIQRQMLQSGKFRFINEQQRDNIAAEIGYQQQGYVDKSMRIKIGRQLGADYLLSGSLRSIKKEQPRQVRIRKSERIYYSLDLTVTDLESSEIIYADQAEIAREASRPIIGW